MTTQARNLATRYYVHGDANESDSHSYYCAACDLFAPRSHFVANPHAESAIKRFRRSLKGWQTFSKKFKHKFRRPYDAENILAEAARLEAKSAPEDHGPFYRWLVKQSKREDPIGDLARDAVSDKAFPTAANSLDTLRNHLYSNRACDEAIVALTEAWTEFEPRRRRRSGLTLALRFAVFRRDDYRCQLCGKTARAGGTLEVDHKVPFSRGGTHSLGNLWTLCFECNRGKGVHTI